MLVKILYPHFLVYLFCTLAAINVVLIVLPFFQWSWCYINDKKYDFGDNCLRVCVRSLNLEKTFFFKNLYEPFDYQYPYIGMDYFGKVILINTVIMPCITISLWPIAAVICLYTMFLKTLRAIKRLQKKVSRLSAQADNSVWLIK